MEARGPYGEDADADVANGTAVRTYGPDIYKVDGTVVNPTNQDDINKLNDFAAKKFLEMWCSAGLAQGQDAKNAIYTEALKFITTVYSTVFEMQVSPEQIFFRYGQNRPAGTKELFRTDEQIGIGSQDDPGVAKKVGIYVYNQTIQEITDGENSFGLIVRALYHETIHAADLFRPRSYMVNKDADEELNAYYKSMTVKGLPMPTAYEMQKLSMGAFSTVLPFLSAGQREAAYKVFNKQFKYFYSNLTEEQREYGQKYYKIPKL